MGHGNWWFEQPGQGGTRTLKQQLTGLDNLWSAVHGRTVLDVGAAEGLIGIQCCRRGALRVMGVERRPEAVKRANYLATGLPFIAITGDAQTFEPVHSYDVVLLLAILHKLPRPAEAFKRYLAACDGLCVVRLRHSDYPVLRDARSGNVAQNLAGVADTMRFELVHVTDGPVDSGNPPEWVGFFQRSAA